MSHCYRAPVGLRKSGTGSSAKPDGTPPGEGPAEISGSALAWQLTLDTSVWLLARQRWPSGEKAPCARETFQRPGMTSTGRCACTTTADDTLPRSADWTRDRPRVPATIGSASSFSASSQIARQLWRRVRVLRSVLVLGHRFIIRCRIPAYGADASKRLRKHPRRLRCFQTRTLTPFAINCLAFGALRVIRFAPWPGPGVGPGMRGATASRGFAAPRPSNRRKRVARLMHRAGVRHRFPGGERKA